jgi:hypothetical protein
MPHLLNYAAPEQDGTLDKIKFLLSSYLPFVSHFPLPSQDAEGGGVFVSSGINYKLLNDILSHLLWSIYKDDANSKILLGSIIESMDRKAQLMAVTNEVARPVEAFAFKKDLPSKLSAICSCLILDGTPQPPPSSLSRSSPFSLPPYFVFAVKQSQSAHISRSPSTN